MNEPSLSIKSFLLAYVGLLGLLLANIFIGYLDFGWGSMFVSLVIAALQAGILVFFLMFGLFEKALVRLIIGGALLWFMIMITLTMTDYITRNWVPIAGK
jgi:cytochrome c oxidase subunit 4